MIATNLEYLEHQVLMTLHFRKGIEFLRRSDVRSLQDGRFEIDGDRVFALVQRYETAITPAPKFECHRKYIDIQFIVLGEEIIGWSPAERMKITEAYNAERDIAFGTVPLNLWTPVVLRAGQATVLWPEDGHAPKLAPGTVSSVMKIVVKVAV